MISSVMFEGAVFCKHFTSISQNKIKLLAYFGASVPRLQAATINGDLEKGVQFIGQTQGLIEDIPTVQELIDRIQADTKAMHERNGRYFS